MELKKTVRQQFEKLFDIRYRKKRKRYIQDYNVWVREMEQAAEENAHGTGQRGGAGEAGADGVAAKSADGGEVKGAGGTKIKDSGRRKKRKAEQEPPETVLLAFAGGCFSQDAKERMERFFAENPDVLLAYGDEDVIIKKNVYATPWLKPCWSPDSYLCRDYLGSAVAVRRCLFEQLTEEECKNEGLCHDRLVALAGGFAKGCKTIAHVNGIFYHRLACWDLPEEGRGGKRLALPKKDTAGAAGRAGSEAEATMDSAGNHTLVSVIIPSKDNVSVLKQCLETLCGTVESTDFEIIVVDNGSSEQSRKAVSREIERLNQENRVHLQKASYVYKPMAFNFSHMCNLGAEAAKGNLLLFLNDDIEAQASGWMEAMVQKALQPWTGAVGYKLLYPDSERIQHAGVTNIALGPTHKLQCLKDAACYYDGRNRGVWNMLAVTGACLMLRRTVFAEAGGFCEKLKVAFNDVDLCFTLYELGYQNVVINSGYLLHHESLSRGLDETEEKVKRLMGERNLLYERHPALEGKDPYYHEWLNGSVLDTAIKPACEEGILFEDTREYEPAMDLSKARVDECLLLRIEYADKERLSGYAVVLGSDNACFKKQLLFKKTKEPDIVYSMDFTEQYRSDLEKNMDQVNVGLCGFYVMFANPLPAGEYRIGMMARDQISGAELVNWSSRTIVSGKEKRKKA